MRFDVVAFERAHIEEAAELLAARHMADRSREPRLSEEYEKSEQALMVLESALKEPGAAGVAAVRGPQVIGYLLSRPLLPAPVSLEASTSLPRGALVGYGCHAAYPEAVLDVYREMYAALSTTWLAAGLFAHYINVPAQDALCKEAWNSLGFAPDLVRTVRSTSEPPEATLDNDVEIRHATLDDLDAVVDLQLSLYKYHADAPIYAPFLPEAFRDLRSQAAEMICDPGAAVLIAYRRGNPVGLQTLHRGFSEHPGVPKRSVLLADGYTSPDARGAGVGTGLLSRSLEWAQQTGYENCLLNYLPANLLAARFWNRSGFHPISYRLFRQVDERIAWAK